jgi:hypothetical protein
MVVDVAPHLADDHRHDHCNLWMLRQIPLIVQADLLLRSCSKNGASPSDSRHATGFERSRDGRAGGGYRGVCAAVVPRRASRLCTAGNEVWAARFVLVSAEVCFRYWLRHRSHGTIFPPLMAHFSSTTPHGLPVHDSDFTLLFALLSWELQAGRRRTVWPTWCHSRHPRPQYKCSRGCFLTHLVVV